MILSYSEDYLKEKGGYNTAKEIAQQPEVWNKLYNSLLNNRNRIFEFLNPLLSNKGLRIILTGAGTSAFVGYSTAGYLRRALSMNVEAIDSTDIVSAPKDYLFKDVETLVISHARSGDSPESVAVIDLAEKLIDNVHFINITCNPEGKLAKRTEGKNNCLNIFMPEESNDLGFAMTSSFTSMLLTDLMLPHIKEIETQINIYEKLIKEAKRILKEDCEKVKAIADNNYDRLIYLGSGCLKGCATEAALKSLELTHGTVNTNSNTYLGFRHGPKSVINDSTLLGFFVSSNSYTQKYELDLINEITSENGNRKLMAIFPYNIDITGIDYPFVLKEDFNGMDEAFLTPLYIIYAQMLGIFKSLQLGITPDNPNPEGHVNRVVKGVTIYDVERD